MRLGAERVQAWGGSLRLLVLSLAILPLFLSQLYGPIGVSAFISDRMLKDFLFKMIGLASIGFLVPVKELRWFWWIVLACHAFTKDALFQGDASFYLLNIGLGLVLFSLVFKFDRLFQWFCQGVVASVIANLALQTLQVLQLDPFHTFWKISSNNSAQVVQTVQVACGFLGNPVTLGVYYAICLPLLAVGAGRFYPALSILTLGGIALTHSKIAFLAAILVFILSSKAWVRENGTRWRWVLEVGFYSFIAVVPFSLMYASSLESAIRHRWVIWNGALTHLTDHWLGDGLSSWALRRFWFEGSLWPQACNEYLQIFYELGYIGLFILILYLVRLSIRVRSSSLTLSSSAALCSVVAVGVTSLFFFPLHLPQTSVPFIISLAYLERSVHVGVS